MFLASFAAGPLAANCYLVATKAGSAGTPQDCVLVDVGMEAAEPLEHLFDQHHLRPVAVVATHGHLDHVADAQQVADAYGCPLYLHPADRGLLTDPVAGTGPMGEQLLASLYAGRVWTEPHDVREVRGGDVIGEAGLELAVTDAPGHRPGCVLLTLAEAGEPLRVLTGDVVFAGSIGRTDLPGGDMQAMARTLRDVVLPLPNDAVLLPGHGQQTWMGHERATNPYLDLTFLEHHL